MHKLECIQTLPISLDEAWEFFATPKNLATITPDYLDFKITSNIPEKMYPGLVITYTVKPLLGISMKWATEITQIKDRSHFIDYQMSGPYDIWHHQHFFKEIDGGVEMTDIVHYKLPLGPLGKFANWLFVRKQVESIFDYRKEKLDSIFAPLVKNVNSDNS